MNSSKKLLMSLALVLCAALPLRAQTVVKFATLAPDGSTWMKAMKAFTDEASAKTAGRVKFKIYAGGVSGDEKDVVRKIRLGQLQAGGFTKDMQQKPAKPPIKNEAANGLKNDRGTLGMARTADVDSATSQFYINVADNARLNHSDREYGYAVFGKVTRGMDVAEAISTVPTGPQGPYPADCPRSPVVIESIRVK